MPQVVKTHLPGSVPPARVILKADDYGDMAAGNDGINELVRRGLLTNVGIMSGCTTQLHVNHLLNAIAASPLPHGVGLALHVNFQTGKPVAGGHNVPSLIDVRGYFKRPEPSRQAWDEYAKSLDPIDVERELDAQIERFAQLVGRLPDALDSHNVILAVPPVDIIAIRKAVDLKMAITYPYLYARTYNGILANQILHLPLHELYREHSLPTADHAYPRYFNSYRHPTDALLKALHHLKPGVTQIVFHPVHPKYASIQTDSEERFTRRLLDFEMLTERRVTTTIAALRAAGSLTSYHQLRQEVFNISERDGMVREHAGLAS